MSAVHKGIDIAQEWSGISRPAIIMISFVTLYAAILLLFVHCMKRWGKIKREVKRVDAKEEKKMEKEEIYEDDEDVIGREEEMRVIRNNVILQTAKYKAVKVE